MANHQPLIVALQSGSVKIKDENHKIETWHISAGALQVENNHVTLLVRKFEANENNQ
jgi:F0F1-type ATP synthase epsilon subunit